MFNTHKKNDQATCSEKNYDNMLNHFHTIAKRDGRTDRQTEFL